SRATSADVASARRTLQQAERNAKAADAEVRARRVQLRVARAEIPTSSKRERFPVARLNRAHDAVTARWMDYETDPAKLIAYPTMSDGKDPATAAFLSASRLAQESRPAADARVTTEEFAAYRDAVAQLERTFDVAEYAARARAEGRDPNAAPAWQDTAQQVFTRSADALDKAAGAAASAFASWNARRQPGKDQPTKDEPGKDQPAKDEPAKDRPAQGGAAQPDTEPAQKPTKVWRVPRRDNL
ncbi:MAG TPA: hypothetical protein DIW46_10560, partial [Microbacterium sp.]|nr:hypothetical protein [Microbacterium sp.]